MPIKGCAPQSKAFIVCLLLLLTLGSCTSLPRDIEPPPEQLALPPAATGTLAGLHSSFAETHGPVQSGFRLLDRNADGLTWRLALFDEAVSSLDLMYYLWHGDDSGRLLLRRAIDAADRGVKVRIIVDDLLLGGKDRALVALNEHPNIQFRIFNPWTNRQVGRGVEFITRMKRLNARMHNKLLIADGHAAILGGRNIGDHYFGLGGDHNFHDLDVLGVGPVAGQASVMFDTFWNSDWVISASALPQSSDEEFVARTSKRFEERLQASTVLEGFPLEPRDWAEMMDQIAQEFHSGASRFVYDRVEDGELKSAINEPLRNTLNTANREILLVNAYVIPDQVFIDGLQSVGERGVQVRILTNSLASHDVPAVNSHYQKWRRPMLEAGIQLYELRPRPAIKSRVDTPPAVSGFVGLHTKAFVVDRQTVFIGSMNFDPRSVNINSEMGVIIESASLAEELVVQMQRDMDPTNAWQVKLTTEGNLVWVNDEETLTRQPARNFWQRILDGFFKLFPAGQF